MAAIRRNVKPALGHACEAPAEARCGTNLSCIKTRPDGRAPPGHPARAALARRSRAPWRRKQSATTSPDGPLAVCGVCPPPHNRPRQSGRVNGAYGVARDGRKRPPLTRPASRATRQLRRARGRVCGPQRVGTVVRSSGGPCRSGFDPNRRGTQTRSVPPVASSRLARLPMPCPWFPYPRRMHRGKAS